MNNLKQLWSNLRSSFEITLENFAVERHYRAPTDGAFRLPASRRPCAIRIFWKGPSN